MALSDLVLKAKVNMALLRDPRVGFFDIRATVDNGRVTLTGDTDTPEECRAAEEIAKSVEGIVSVRNEMTCGIGQNEDTAELVTQRFLEKLDTTWHNLPDRSALSQADYLRWALWMVYKFHIPRPQAPGTQGSGMDPKVKAAAIEQALERIAGHVGAPKALVALEMLRQAEQIATSPYTDAPRTANPDLVATPVS